MRILQRKNGSWQLWYVDKNGKRKAVTLKVDGRNPKTEKEAEKARDAVIPSLYLDRPPKYSTARRKTAKKKHEIISRQPYTRDEIDDILRKLEAGTIMVPYRIRTHGRTVVVDRPIKVRYKEEMRLAILLGAYCGLRLKDAVCVTSEQYIGGDLVLKPAKTRNTTGVEVTIPILHEGLREALEGCTGYLTPHLKALHEKSDAMCARLFSDIFRWCGYKTTLECDDRPNASIKGFHALRHSFVTWCCEAGVPIEVVQTVVGHTSKVTTRIYNHISAKRKAEELGKIMRGNA
jgi:integrase